MENRPFRYLYLFPFIFVALCNDAAAQKVVQIASGYNHHALLREDGSVWTWGDNQSAQLGDGTKLNRAAPAVVPELTNVVKIAAGGFHTLALKGDGTVWTWGANDFGQLGDGSTAIRNSALPVVGLSGVIAVAGGGYHSLALKSDGTVWAWGFDRYGQLGDGGNVDRPARCSWPDYRALSVSPPVSITRWQ